MLSLAITRNQDYDGNKCRFLRFHPETNTLEFRFLCPCEHKAQNAEKVIDVLTDYLASNDKFEVKEQLPDSVLNSVQSERYDIVMPLLKPNQVKQKQENRQKYIANWFAVNLGFAFNSFDELVKVINERHYEHYLHELDDEFERKWMQGYSDPGGERPRVSERLREQYEAYERAFLEQSGRDRQDFDGGYSIGHRFSDRAFYAVANDQMRSMEWRVTTDQGFPSSQLMEIVDDSNDENNVEMPF